MKLTVIIIALILPFVAGLVGRALRPKGDQAA